MITGNYKKLTRLHTDKISNRKYKPTLHFRLFSLFFHFLQTVGWESNFSQHKILLNCCNKMEGQTVAAKCYK